MTDFPKQTREMMIRSEIQKLLESPNASNRDAVKLAGDFTDTKFIENQKQKATKERRPHGESFEAIKVFQEKFVHDDPFLCFEFDDDMDGLPLVVKSSRRKVEILTLLDCDESHRLSNAVVYSPVSNCTPPPNSVFWKIYHPISNYYNPPKLRKLR